jgi:hypothetical protein
MPEERRGKGLLLQLPSQGILNVCFLVLLPPGRTPPRTQFFFLGITECPSMINLFFPGS